MDILRDILVLIHILGTAAIVGGWFANFRTPTVTQWQHIGAWVQLITGLALVGVLEMGDGEVNHMKIGIKLVIAIVILVLAIVGTKKEAKAPGSTGTLAMSAGLLAILNVIIAVFV